MKKAFLFTAVSLGILSFFVIFSVDTFDNVGNITANVYNETPHEILDSKNTVITDDVSFSLDSSTDSTMVASTSLYSINDFLLNSDDVTIGTENVVYKKCPFYPKKDRVILDFTKNGTIPINDLLISANKDIFEATRTFSNFNIKPGVYRISLASYHDINYDKNELYGQIWNISLYDSSKNKIITTNNTRDILNNETSIEEVVENNININSNANTAVIKHASYPSAEEYVFAPLCASFDLVDINDNVEKKDISEFINSANSVNSIKRGTQTISSKTDSAMRTNLSVLFFFILLVSFGGIVLFGILKPQYGKNVTEKDITKV